MGKGGQVYSRSVGEVYEVYPGRKEGGANGGGLFRKFRKGVESFHFALKVGVNPHSRFSLSF